MSRAYLTYTNRGSNPRDSNPGATTGKNDSLCFMSHLIHPDSFRDVFLAMPATKCGSPQPPVLHTYVCMHQSMTYRWCWRRLATLLLSTPNGCVSWASRKGTDLYSRWLSGHHCRCLSEPDGQSTGILPVDLAVTITVGQVKSVVPGGEH